MITPLLGTLSGLAMGLTGGGGSLFAIPLLVYGLGLSLGQSITLSLFAVGGVALVGTAQRLRDKSIEIRAGLTMAFAGFLTSPVGAWLGTQMDESLLFALFAALTISIATTMWVKAQRKPEEAKAVRGSSNHGDQKEAHCRFDETGRLDFTKPCFYALLLAGMITGTLSGLFGVGGGFLIVPALMLTTRMPIQQAVSTSLLVISIVAVSAIGSHLYSKPLPDLTLTGLFLGGGIAGLLIGSKIADRIAGPALQKVFALMLIIAGGFMFVREFILTA